MYYFADQFLTIGRPVCGGILNLPKSTVPDSELGVFGTFKPEQGPRFAALVCTRNDIDLSHVGLMRYSVLFIFKAGGAPSIK